LIKGRPSDTGEEGQTKEASLEKIPPVKSQRKNSPKWVWTDSLKKGRIKKKGHKVTIGKLKTDQGKKKGGVLEDQEHRRSAVKKLSLSMHQGTRIVPGKAAKLEHHPRSQRPPKK